MLPGGTDVVGHAHRGGGDQEAAVGVGLGQRTREPAIPDREPCGQVIGEGQVATGPIAHCHWTAVGDHEAVELAVGILDVGLLPLLARLPVELARGRHRKGSQRPAVGIGIGGRGSPVQPRANPSPRWLWPGPVRASRRNCRRSGSPASARRRARSRDRVGGDREPGSGGWGGAARAARGRAGPRNRGRRCSAARVGGARPRPPRGRAAPARRPGGEGSRRPSIRKARRVSPPGCVANRWVRLKGSFAPGKTSEPSSAVRDAEGQALAGGQANY